MYELLQNLYYTGSAVAIEALTPARRTVNHPASP